VFACCASQAIACQCWDSFGYHCCGVDVVNGLLSTVPFCLGVAAFIETKSCVAAKECGNYTLLENQDCIQHVVCSLQKSLACPIKLTFAATYKASSEGACVKRRYCGTAHLQQAQLTDEQFCVGEKQHVKVQFISSPVRCKHSSRGLFNPRDDRQLLGIGNYLRTLHAGSVLSGCTSLLFSLSYPTQYELNPYL